MEAVSRKDHYEEDSLLSAPPSLDLCKHYSRISLLLFPQKMIQSEPEELLYDLLIYVFPSVL